MMKDERETQKKKKIKKQTKTEKNQWGQKIQ